MLYYLLGILCSHSLGVGNLVSKSNRPFGGRKEEEGSLLKMLAVANRCSNRMKGLFFPLFILKWHALRKRDVIQTLQRGGGRSLQRGFVHYYRISKGVLPNPPSYASGQ